MKLYLAFMLAGFLFTDAPGNGMGWGVALFATLGLGVGTGGGRGGHLLRAT